MLVRVVQFLLGAMLAAGGGYLAWDQRGQLASVFPPGQAGAPWLLMAGVFALCAAVVFLISAVHPLPNRRKALAVKAEHEGKVLAEADTYYAEAHRAADRDWRSGDLPPPAKPLVAASKPALVDLPPAAAAPVPAAPAPEAPAPQAPAPQAPVAAAPVAPAPEAPPKADPAPPAQAEPAAAKTVASGVQPQPAEPAAPALVFPATATLHPIPPSAEPPPAPAAEPAPAPPAPAVVETQPDPHAAITNAIRDGRLDEAEQLLNAQRESAEGIVLAQLTALAGDHAAAAGRQSHAKWLWRLAIKRFGELNAMDTAAAQRAAESLRIAS